MPLLVPRFWTPPGTPIKAGLEFGEYLPDPERRPTLNRHVVGISGLDRRGCTMLLGDPGMGKTTALAAAVEDVAARRPGDAVWAVDLGATGQEERLRRSVFEAPAYRAWSAGGGILHLFLDSFDEARLRVETVADLLVEGLKDADLRRLRLRIACRSGDRHRQFERRLADLFGEQRFAVLELLPLRRIDVAALADAAGVPSEPFLREIDHGDLSALAVRPMTLRLLLSAAAGGAGLASGLIELYRRGCRLWAEEPDEDRRSGTAAGRLDGAARLAVASRIAAAVVLSGRVGVHLDAASLPDGDHVALEALCGGRELRDGAVRDAFAVDEAAVRETLRTGLFVARGEGRFVFVHQTVAEFLAASYVATRMRREQILSLVTVREDGGPVVVPQLTEVVRWLCGLSPEVFAEMLVIDPKLVLSSDLSSLPIGRRVALVDALLRLDPRGVGKRALLEAVPHLVHPGLERQLRALLEDRAAPPRARGMAVELFGAVQPLGLADRIVDLAYDDQEPMALRKAAVGALARPWLPRADRPEPEGVPDAVLRRLRPLALEPLDGLEPLRGAALELLWPEHIGVDELFASLPAPEPLSGGYATFVDYWLPRRLDEAGLKVAIDWATAQRFAHQPREPLFRLVERLLIDGWEHRGNPEVLASLVALVRKILREGTVLIPRSTVIDETWHPIEGIHVNDVFRDRDGRRALVAALVPDVADGSLDAGHLTRACPPLLDAADLPWLEEEREGAAEAGLRAGWERLLGAARERLRPPAAAGAGAGAGAGARALAPTEEPPDVAALVAADLARFEAGDLDAFWHLNEHLALDPTDPLRPGPWAFRSDLTWFPGWRLVDEETQRRIVDAAQRFLAEKDPAADGWFGADLVWEPAKAGFRALRLLAKQDPPRVDEAGAGVWERWAPIIVAWPQAGAETITVDVLVMLCFHMAPGAAGASFFPILDRAVAERDSAWPIGRLDRVDVKHVEQPLLDRFLDEAWPPKARGELLEFLLWRGSVEAREAAGSLLRVDALTDESRERLGRFAQALVERAGDAGWASVWPLILADEAFGSALLRRVAARPDPVMLAERLSPGEVVDLALWVDEHWPSGRGEAVPEWCDRQVMALAARGSDAALEALDRLPAGRQRDVARRDARAVARRAGWQPPQPGEIVRLGANRARRWVLADVELREVLVEALARAQAALQGPTPAAADLWDTTARRPKHENAISDWLQRWLVADLRGRGIVIGREVQIRPGPGAKMGESGDLVVEAIAAERTAGAEVVTVTVEVKGCWHREVEDAMRHQLVDRYLLPTGRTQGIYVVAWFPQAAWDPTDHRRARSRRDLDELRASLAAQAEELSAARGVGVDAVVLDCSPPGLADAG